MLLENCPFPHDRRVMAEATSLVEAGYGVTVIAPALPSQPIREVVAGVAVYRYPAPPAIRGVLGFVWEYSYAMVASFVLALYIFIRRGFDVVHAHNPPDLFVAIAALYRPFGVKFVFDHHDLSPEMYSARFNASERTPIYRLLVWLERLSCRCADRVIATNESHVVIETERAGVPRDRITVVRNGPDLDFRAVDPDLDLRRRAKTIIGFVGAMSVQDGVDYFLRALRRLVHDLGKTDVFCVLVGDGADRPRLEALTSELGLAPYVWFTGPLARQTWLPYLSAADICIEPAPSNPYNDRSTTLKLAEYMALAKPIVAFDLPEHRVTAGQSAHYVRPNDEAEFARALAQLMDDPARREMLGAHGRRRMESTLAWPHSVPCLLRAYRALFEETTLQSTAGAIRAGSGSRLGRWAWWLRERSIGYLALRTIALAKRYGVTSPKAERRVLACVKRLAVHGCHPTFPIPGWVLRRYSEFSRTLQAMGAELAIHGYQHVDFRSLSLVEAGRQFREAGAAFHEFGIHADGYRCPYLSATEDLKSAIPDGLVHYSSNRAIWWGDAIAGGSDATPVFENIRRFYRAESSREVVSTPRLTNGLVEIPCSVPDDLQLTDGLRLDPSGIQRVWTDMLQQIHRRGELFVVLFHPESYDHIGSALEGVVREARRMQPGVWITQLRDVSRWWQERAGWSVDVSPSSSSGLHVRFNCSERATVLVRHIDAEGLSPWSDSYGVLSGRTLDVAGGVRPFVGVASDVPAQIVAFLEEQGYIVERGDTATSCGVYLDASWSKDTTEVQLVDHIESSPAPLVRFWRWPAAARSALCVTGDLDALSLTDYVARVFTL
jgi:glycosyltransferase involved in cell wall biosynthesis/peptidoglycan/xylan/chitin deacetylase (PgdA/CDA1 family)